MIEMKLETEILTTKKSFLGIVLLFSLKRGREAMTQFGITLTSSESNARSWVKTEYPASKCNIETHFTTVSWQSDSF